MSTARISLSRQTSFLALPHPLAERAAAGPSSSRGLLPTLTPLPPKARSVAELRWCRTPNSPWCWTSCGCPPLPSSHRDYSLTQLGAHLPISTKQRAFVPIPVPTPSIVSPEWERAAEEPDPHAYFEFMGKNPLEWFEVQFAQRKGLLACQHIKLWVPKPNPCLKVINCKFIKGAIESHLNSPGRNLENGVCDIMLRYSHGDYNVRLDPEMWHQLLENCPLELFYYYKSIWIEHGPKPGSPFYRSCRLCRLESGIPFESPEQLNHHTFEPIRRAREARLQETQRRYEEGQRQPEKEGQQLTGQQWRTGVYWENFEQAYNRDYAEHFSSPERKTELDSETSGEPNLKDFTEATFEISPEVNYNAPENATPNTSSGIGEKGLLNHSHWDNQAATQTYQGNPQDKLLDPSQFPQYLPQQYPEGYSKYAPGNGYPEEGAEGSHR